MSSFSSMPAGSAGYGPDAEILAQRFEAVTFEAAHHDVLPWVPVTAGRVMDVGAGSGRDAAALATRGHRVVAVEPTAELRRIGQRLHSDVTVEWLDDSLPDLVTVRGPFDLILLSAVWMHLDVDEREAGMRRLSQLLAPGGRMIMSLRHGPVPDGRRMFAVSPAETVSLAGTCGLHMVHRGESEDLRARPGVSWSTVVVCKDPGQRS